MKDVIEHYDKLIAENNDPARDPLELREYMDRWDGQKFIDAMQLDSGKSVLEIGVGTGRLALKVAPKCKTLCGIDISPKTIERAAENLSPYKNVKLICADLMTYELDERFDVICSSLTFMHIKDKAAAIKKVASLLKEGGLFVLSVDKNQDGFIDMGTRKIKIYPDTPEHIRSCIERAGLTFIKQLETEFAYLILAQTS